MRHFAYGDDNLKGKIYDKELLKNLIHYLKPYWYLVVISFVLLLIIAFTQIFAPVIQKKAVDEVIAAKQDAIMFNSFAEAQKIELKYPKIKFKKYSYNNQHFLIFPKRKISFFKRGEINNLKRFKRITIVEYNKHNIDILADSLMQISPDTGIVSIPYLKRLYQNKKISGKQLFHIRSLDIKKLKKFALILLILVVTRFALLFSQIYSINYASQHAMYDLRREAFFHLSNLPLSFFDKNPVGRLVTRVTNDIRTLDQMLSDGLIQLLQQFLILIGIVIMMFLYNWKLTLVTFSILPFIIVLFVVFIKKTRVIYRSVRKKIAKINSMLSENISGIKIIQLFNLQRIKLKQFRKLNLDYYGTAMKQLRLFAFFRPLINSSRRFAVALLLWYGGVSILQDKISLGLFIAFLSYVDMFFEPINQLSEKFNIIQAAMAGAERIFDLMGNGKEEYRSHLSNGDKFKGKVEFKNVWLKYDRDYVLKDVSFTINSGESVALVGHTGAGKTSIISLLSALYPYQKGKILIDNKEFTQYSLEDLRKNIGIVQQDVFLFSGTIRENIALDKDMSDEKLTEISKYINVYNFIEGLQDKFDEPVMERGATFSVGQRQLITFARVLAYNPAIFVLDEATSNIDTETELLIQDALKKIIKGRTSIIIAHRLSTIQHVDRIIVMHKGEVRESGSHQELLDKKGLYYDLYRLQYQ